MNISPLNICLLGVIGLVAAGFYGLLTTRNLIKVVIMLRILVKAAVLGLITAGNISGQLYVTQSMAITVIVADTIVAVIGMAFAIQIRRQVGTLDTNELSSLRG